MNAHLVLNNLTAYSLQVGVLVALAACVPELLRLRDPKTRLWFWRLALAACLTLPALRAWRVDAATGEVRVLSGPMVVVGAPGAPAPTPLPWTEIALAVIALGIGVRLAILCAGFWRLQRYRQRSVEVRDGVFQGDVSVRISHEIEGPVTFGIIRPVILLPERFPHLDAATRDAILHHEMLHVARFDWLETVAQELVRAALWFHPAIWWLLGEMQLTREQAVDREVIEATNAAEQYVDALLEIARADVALDLAPAFLRRRQLKQRVVSILKERRMPERKISKTRAASTMALAAGLLAVGAWTVTGVFPLKAQTHTVADDSGVSVDTFGAALQHRVGVLYPVPARDKKIEGTVMAQLRLSGTGTVIDAQIISGPDELRSPVLQSVLGWHFSKDLAGSVRQVAVTFKLASEGAPVTVMTRDGLATVTVQSRDGVSSAAIPRKGSGENPSDPPTVRSINFTNTNITADQAAALPLHAGDKMTPERLTSFRAAIAELDEHYQMNMMVTAQGATLTVMMPSPRQAPAVTERSLAAPPQPTQATASGAEGPLVVGGRVQSAKLVSSVDPVYPQMAKTARIQGKVILEAVIGPDGHVNDLALISGHPLLQQAAIEAVRQWVYQVTYLNNMPVAVKTTIEVNFTLSN